MATWSGIRKKLETEYLAQSLQGHIQYYATSYSRSHDHEGRAAVKFGIDAVAKMPIDSKFAKACDNGEIEEVEGGWLDTIADKLLG